jgi:hypothetical protein
MNTTENEDEKKDIARTDIDPTMDETTDESPGETSTIKGTGNTSFSGAPKRKSTSLGSSHEPGTSPGREF